jgi:SAM-dependent methyltransferase
MAGYPRILRVWDESRAPIIQDFPSLTRGPFLAGPHHPTEFADRLYACESLNPPGEGPRVEAAAEPYSLQWFLNIEDRRHRRQGRWIPRVLEFSKHSGETLLGLGNSLGTDWLQYARHGAAVVVCSASSDQLRLVRRNFELRGLTGRFLHSTPTSLPLVGASIDVACVSGLLGEVSNPGAIVDEIYRVLKPGGKALAVTSAYYDVDFWFDSLFPWEKWFRKRPMPQEPPRTAFTARGLRRLFARFSEHRVYKRHLCRADVPHLWRWVPRPLLERLMGKVLVLKAFKPLSAALPVQAIA